MAKRMKKRSLLSWMILLFTICVLVSFSLVVAVNSVIKTAQENLTETREVKPGNSELDAFNYNLRINKDPDVTENTKIAYVTDVIKNVSLYRFLDWMLIALPILIFGANLVLFAWLFYRYKLRAPIHALQDAVDNIEKRDLDFTLSYRSEDELGLLCKAFDTMRDKLKNSFISLWEEKEKQTILTRALAHDLRTPLTVIKGHNDLLAMYLKNKTLSLNQAETVYNSFNESILRMEKYLDNTRDIHCLEGWQLLPDSVSSKNIAEKIDKMKTINPGIDLLVENKTDRELQLDEALIIRVLENVLSNAFEHARQEVAVKIDCIDGFLAITVQDDGKGFSPEALHYATAPYFREERARFPGHTGLGLTIAQILTERHGGQISWGNTDKGAFVKIIFKSL